MGSSTFSGVCHLSMTALGLCSRPTEVKFSGTDGNTENTLKYISIKKSYCHYISCSIWKENIIITYSSASSILTIRHSGSDWWCFGSHPFAVSGLNLEEVGRIGVKVFDQGRQSVALDDRRGPSCLRQNGVFGVEYDVPCNPMGKKRERESMQVKNRFMSH